MQAIASRGLRALRQECLHIPLQHSPQFSLLLKLLFEDLRPDPITEARHLNESSPRPASGPEQNGKPNNTVEADYADFNRVAIFHGDYRQSNAFLEKIRMRKLSVSQRLFLSSRSGESCGVSRANSRSGKLASSRFL